jgi:hypothetical protein
MPPMPAKRTARPDPVGPLGIDVRPLDAGNMIMTFPVGLVLSENQARRLLASIHDSLDGIRKLAGPAAVEPEKNGKPAGRGIAGGKRKR